MSEHASLPLSPPAFAVPRTADEWWEQAAYVRAVMHEWGPENEAVGRVVFDGNVRHAEAILGKPLFDLFRTRSADTFYTILDDLIARRDPLAWNVFQSVWADAPDSPIIRSWTGWFRLCDLCSEGMDLIVGTQASTSTGGATEGKADV